MRAVGCDVIDFVNHPLPSKTARQFSLRDLLIWTALSGGLLFMLKRLAPDFTLGNEGARVILFMASFAVINLAAMWGVLGNLHAPERVPLSMLTIFLIGMIIAQLIPGPKVNLVEVLATMVFNLVIVFLLYRFLGYRLVWRSWRKTE